MPDSNQHSAHVETLEAFLAKDSSFGRPYQYEAADALAGLVEQLETAHTALKMWVEAVEGSDLIRMEPSYEPLRAALHETDAVLGLKTKTWPGATAFYRPVSSPARES